MWLSAPIAENHKRAGARAAVSIFKNREFFAQHISYTSKTYRPTSDEAIGNDLVQAYMKLRSMGNTTKTVTATPR